ncbi:hypothetical protein JD844_018234 [Phrynosoma platyrhinos]|uniref:Protein kinase domain-containing protein n=1 Tax=Phrynosoma platyrhinos TaxID=52577 RepID=A0ABQ7SN87_PHRPL|nr:hypothetical protein JD844_018234 [Phrynosoma platyrhinos]
MSFPSRKGFYRQEVNKTVWELPRQYTSIVSVGSGAYGSVCSAIDKKTGEKVIGLLDVFTSATSFDGFQDFYLVMPYMRTDLQKIMGHQFSEEKIQYLIYQVLKGLKYIHSAGIIHRDLKPGNLAVNEDCELKGELSSAALDLDQLTQILKVTGSPGEEFIQKLEDKAAKSYIQTLPKIPKMDLSRLFPKASPLGYSEILDSKLRNFIQIKKIGEEGKQIFRRSERHFQYEDRGVPEGFRSCIMLKISECSISVSFIETQMYSYLFILFQGHIYNEILSFSPIARKDSKRRSGMTL